ncbi:hypothetical protein J4477_02775 [Candidatus Pacearchaeota archaeon]|nr:hypothetical protein [Candidatus Pacearchaeota archaeon]
MNLLYNLAENLKINYRNFRTKVDLDNPSSFEEFVDRETHQLLAQTGLFPWDSEGHRFEGLSSETYNHCRDLVAKNVAFHLDIYHKLSSTKNMADYLAERGLLFR